MLTLQKKYQPKQHHVYNKGTNIFWSVHKTTEQTVENSKILIPYFNIYPKNTHVEHSNDMLHAAVWINNHWE